MEKKGFWGWVKEVCSFVLLMVLAVSMAAMFIGAIYATADWAKKTWNKIPDQWEMKLKFELKKKKGPDDEADPHR